MAMALSAVALNGLTSSMAGLSLSSRLSEFRGVRLPVASPPTLVLRKAPSRCIPQMLLTRKEWLRRKRLKLQKIHVKIGDVVKVIEGKHKGKIGEIIDTSHRYGTVIVKGVNIRSIYKKPRTPDEKPYISTRERPIHHSNVQVYSEKYQVSSRIGKKWLEDGRKVRYLIKTGEVIDSFEQWKKLRYRDRSKKKPEQAAIEAKKSDGSDEKK